MRTETANKIIEYIRLNKQARVIDLVREFNLSYVAVHRQLKNLINQDKIKKIGSAPIVFYTIGKTVKLPKIKLSKNIITQINRNYLYITPQGEIIEGWDGFCRWVSNIKQDKYLHQLAGEYLRLIDRIHKKYYKQNWIDATYKIKNTFKKVYIDKLFYQDFYSIPKFGKTKLGQLVLYAKQSQKYELINRIINEIEPVINKIIKYYNISTVAYIPATIPRKIQFIKEIENDLNLKLPQIDLVKVKSGDILIAQKTLSKLDDRVVNARDTIFIKDNKKISSNILLIDDAAGSGATFNQTAKKIKETRSVKKIIAFALVGSFKGFDVIREI